MRRMFPEFQPLMEAAEAQGALGCEILERKERTVEINVNDIGVSDQDRAQEIVRITLWLEGGREGRAEGSWSRSSSLLTKALKMAAGASEDPLSGPIDPLDRALTSLGIKDKRYEQITMDDRVEVPSHARRTALAVNHRVEAGAFTYQDSLLHRRFANSKGLILEETSTTYRLAGSVGIQGTTPRVTFASELASRTFASICALPLGIRLARQALMCAGEGPELKGAYRVMFTPHATAQLFSVLAKAFSGPTLNSNKTFLSKAKDGEPLFDHRVHMLDDGSMSGGLNTHQFDDHGVPPVPVVLLKEGIVSGAFLDPASARSMGEIPTGHSCDRVLTPTNLVIRGGTRSISALVSEQDREVLIVSDLGDMSGLNMKNGMFHCKASGMVRRSKEDLGAFYQLPLEGSLIEVFRNVIALASNTDRIGHVDAPGMMCDGFVVS